MTSSNPLASFESQLSAYENLASNGFSTPSLTKPVSSTSSSTASTLGSLSGLANPGGAIANALSGVSGSLFSSRIVAIILGLICVAGAIFLFKGPAVITLAKRAVTTTAESGA